MIGVSLSSWVITFVTDFLREIACSKSFSSSSATATATTATPHSINLIHHPIHHRRAIIHQLRSDQSLLSSPSTTATATSTSTTTTTITNTTILSASQALMQAFLRVNEYNSMIFRREFNRHLLSRSSSPSSPPFLSSHSFSEDLYLDQIPPNWILVEWVYDKNMDYFGIARWSANVLSILNVLTKFDYNWTPSCSNIVNS